MSTAANPYAAPRAQVADRFDDDGATQPVRLWPPDGRVGRLRYLAYTTGGWLLMALALVIVGAIAGALNATWLIVVATVVGYLALIVFGVVVTIQRCHDLDWSGWMTLLSLVPLLNLAFLVVPGSKGRNRFGAPPPPNTLGVKLLGCILPLLFAVGILAAIALPAYQQYVQRAKAAQVK